ncbi:MAG: hypothetical protein L0Z53_03820 [Acidobacteriales bacterium]|nr:hypothetical protein [Terriglobales bacterium]
MSTAATKKPDLTEIAAQWREARRLYAVYSALLGRYALGLPPCRELESPVDRADPDAIRNVWNWFAQMDARVHVHQLRQLIQTTRLGTEENLRTLIQRHLAKTEKTEADRDKIDFLLVQYLSTCSPAGFYEREATLEEIAQVLEPVLGEVGHNTPDWLKPLEKATKSLDELSSLRDLLENRTLDQMRKLKAGAGEMYFGPTALAAITRFNFMVRRTFVRLIAADLTAVRGALHELESRGIEKVDCSRAQLGRAEPVENLKQIVAEWKKPFRAAYAAGQNFRQLVEIRIAVEKALSGGAVAASGDDDADRSTQTRVAQPSSAVRDVSSAVQDMPLTEDAFKAPAFAPEPDFNLEPRFSASSGAESKHSSRDVASYVSGGAASSASSDADTEFAAALAHVHSPQSASSIPVETPSSIASQLFQGAASSSALNWEPVGDEVDDTPPPPPVARSATGSPGLQPRVSEANQERTTTLDIHETATTIAQQLVANHVKKGQVATITGEDLKLLLSSWEVDAFIAGGNETASALQRIVAARAMLIQQLEKKKRSVAAQVGEAVRLAQAEVNTIQEKIAAAKEKKDIDAAVNMAATCKRLQTLITEAEKKS